MDLFLDASSRQRLRTCRCLEICCAMGDGRCRGTGWTDGGEDDLGRGPEADVIVPGTMLCILEGRLL